MMRGDLAIDAVLVVSAVGGALRANDDETATPRKFTLEGA